MADHNQRRTRPFCVRNCGNTAYGKTVLFSHLLEPLFAFSVRHANHLECLYTIDALHDLGCNVDVYDYRYLGDIDYAPYDLVYGFGHPWSGVFDQNAHRPLAVHYSMIAHPFHVLSQSSRALRGFYRRNGLWLKRSGRAISDVDYMAEPFYADAVVLLGNEHSRAVFETYYLGPVYLQCAPYNDVLAAGELAGKDFQAARKHFLWFGSRALIYKGLDLTLEAFAQRPEAVLHICAVPEDEDFFAYYKDILSLPNINFYGFIDLQGEQFRNLMRTCAFSICPSWAEGQATSVVNSMANGLVPIVSRDCGIESEAYVFELPENDIPSILETIDRCLGLEAEQVASLSARCLAGTRERHGKEAYCAMLKRSLAVIMSAGSQ